MATERHNAGCKSVRNQKNIMIYGLGTGDSVLSCIVAIEWHASFLNGERHNETV